MFKFRTWKEMRRVFSSQKRSLDLFFKEELPDTRNFIDDIFTEKPIIDFEIYRSSLFKIIKEKNVDKGNIGA